MKNILRQSFELRDFVFIFAPAFGEHPSGQHLKSAGIFHGTKIDVNNTLTTRVQHTTICKSHFMRSLAGKFQP